MQKKNVLFYLFTLATTLFFGICFTSTDFITTPIGSIKDIAVLFLQWGVIMVALYGTFTLLAINKYVFAIVFPVMTFISGILAYYRFTINAAFTPMILDAALENDYRTSAELVSVGLIIFLLITLAFAVALIYFRFKYVTVSKVYRPILIGLLLLVTFTQVDRFKRPISERIPFNIYYTSMKYQAEREVISENRTDLTEGITCTDDELTVVFVLGESLRPDHLGFNGYERNTTPNLSKEDIISFPYIYTEQTYTNRSVPHLLTRADSTDYSLAYKEKSFISFFNACDYHTAWLTNQEAAETFVYFMNECDILKHVNMEKSTYTFDKWVDADLLPYLDQILNADYKKNFILLHTIGSHWWYNSHFTDEFEQFKPVSKSRVVSSNTQEEMINSYDNTVLYTDYFLSNVINRLRDRKAILIYQSDHGEALGEDGVWLHATESPYTHQAACFVWMSPSYKEAYPSHYDHAKANSMSHYRTDYLFHSILDAGGIESPVINESLSIFR